MIGQTVLYGKVSMALQMHNMHTADGMAAAAAHHKQHTKMCHHVQLHEAPWAVCGRTHVNSETCICVTWLLAKASSFAGANGCKPLLPPWPCSSILTLPCMPAPLQLLVWIDTRYSVLTAASTASCCSSCWSSSSASARQWTDSHGFHLSFSARQWAVSLVLLHPLQGNAQTLSEARSLNTASCRRSVKLDLQLHAAFCH